MSVPERNGRIRYLSLTLEKEEKELMVVSSEGRSGEAGET